jgi:hypothetical protein
MAVRKGTSFTSSFYLGFLPKCGLNEKGEKQNTIKILLIQRLRRNRSEIKCDFDKALSTKKIVQVQLRLKKQKTLDSTLLLMSSLLKTHCSTKQSRLYRTELAISMIGTGVALELSERTS